MSAALAVKAETWPAAPPDAAAPEISVSGLSVRYGAQPPVFAGISLAVSAGESVALVGRNGAGKSTLLRCFLGFVEPSEGEVELFGQRLATSGSRAMQDLRGKVGFVAQKHNLVPRLSALSNVVHGCLAARPGPRQWLQSLAPPEVRERALAALDQVGLAGLATRRADRLSGGQSQRVAIARALVAKPRLMLADEPAASLDPVAGEEVMATFSAVAHATRTTLVFTTHHLDHALRYADRILGLQDGLLVLDAPAKGISLGRLRELFD